MVVTGGGGRPQAAGAWRSGMVTAAHSAQDSPAQQELSGLHVRSAGPCILAVIKETKNTALFSAVLLSYMIEK